MEKTKLLNTYVNNVTLKEAVEFCCRRYGSRLRPMWWK